MVSNVAKLPAAGTVHWLNECIARGEAEVFSETITINPALAGIILAKNDHNRNIRPAKLAQFAADMRKGRWAFNGELFRAFGRALTIRGADGASPHLIQSYNEPDFVGVLMPMRTEARPLADWI